jgi:isoleucyl-tRNA synthetase
VWTTRFPDRGSLHLQEIHPLPDSWQDAALAERFKALRALRVQVSEAIEPMRREKIVGSSLAATVTVPADAPEGDLAELFITGTVTRGQGSDVTVAPTTDHKCGRCWRHLPEVTADGDLCGRCDGVVNG